jgi:hypothetical protein
MDGRVHFVGGISSDHVLDGFVAARVVLHPGIDLEDMLVHDNNGPAVCDELLDLLRGHDRVLPGGCPTLGRIHGWRRVDVIRVVFLCRHRSEDATADSSAGQAGWCVN